MSNTRILDTSQCTAEYSVLQCKGSALPDGPEDIPSTTAYLCTVHSAVCIVHSALYCTVRSAECTVQDFPSTTATALYCSAVQQSASRYSIYQCTVSARAQCKGSQCKIFHVPLPLPLPLHQIVWWETFDARGENIFLPPSNIQA